MKIRFALSGFSGGNGEIKPLNYASRYHVAGRCVFLTLLMLARAGDACPHTGAPFRCGENWKKLEIGKAFSADALCENDLPHPAPETVRRFTRPFERHFRAARIHSPRSSGKYENVIQSGIDVLSIEFRSRRGMCTNQASLPSERRRAKAFVCGAAAMAQMIG